MVHGESELNTSLSRQKQDLVVQIRLFHKQMHLELKSNGIRDS